MLTFICQDVEPEECVVICHQGKEVEMELEDDQSLLFSTLKSQWSTATGLLYWPNENADNNRSRGIRMTGEKFLPPKHGWGNRIYHVVTSDKDTTTIKGINKSSIWIYTILGMQMNDMFLMKQKYNFLLSNNLIIECRQGCRGRSRIYSYFCQE